MATYNYKPGLQKVGQYQMSGVPFAQGQISCIGGNAELIKFPGVTNFITITNNDTSGRVLGVGFSKKGLGNNTARFDVFPSQSVGVLPLRITELHLTGSDRCSVIAGITGIDTAAIDVIAVSPSGSNWSGSLGARTT
jgi:hypothetical protein|tara:strand:- start:727 stop:1137 length:411 start_codon:yes stop_codon:yes gene_type:complete